MGTIEFKGISKFFPGVKALDSISFKAESGNVYAFLGENGAGKSTLLKIMNGDYEADSGHLLINGRETTLSSPKEAIANGISVIYQERQILKEMTVSENIFLGDWLKTKSGAIDFSLMNKKTAEIAARFGLNLQPDEKVGKLSIAYQQMVEIMKAINRDSQIIAFDEPTASLSDNEIDILFHIIDELKKEGKLIFYVSHRMNEIAKIAQKVIVFKDGKLVDMVDVDKVTNDKLIRMMVGRPLGKIFEELERNTTIGNTVLEYRNVSTDYISDISFSAKKGEILGFAGLVGAGRTEIMKAMFGLDKIKSGTIILEGHPIFPKSPSEAIAQGIALVPEDRKEQGILPNISVRGNISISILKQFLNACGGINVTREEEIANKEIKRLNIKTPNSEKLISQLSGGNQQKTILGRWLVTNPKVLILDEPTKGIDVGAKSEFYKIICECAKLGMVVLVVSSELPEIIGLSDRIVVVREGQISKILERKEATEETILKYAMIEKN
jgi:ABC-type sugar transport system ATPase subunit